MSEIPKSVVLQVNPRKIEPNPDNPRLLFDDSPMEELSKSIQRRGVMVPLIVFRKSPNSDNFVLLDGERRLRCSIKLGLKEVPVNEIQKPKPAENIIRMFNIHVLREEWELVPMAFALEKLIEILEKDGKKTTNAELAKLTRLPNIRVAECRRILKYKKYLHLSLNPDPKKRIGGDFFSQLDLVVDTIKKYPSILDEFPRKQFIELMIKKKQEGTIVNLIQEFRMFKKILESSKEGVDKKRIIENVKDFLRSEPSKEKDASGKPKTKAMSMQDLYEKTSSSAYTESQIIKTTKTLDELLDKITFNEIKNKAEFKKVLTNLTEKIKQLLQK